MRLQWTEFADLAQSTGSILLVVLVLWTLMGFVIYWAISSGAASMKEGVKLRMVEDDKPVPQGGERYGRYPA